MTTATLPRPSWQSGTGVSGTGRLVPDVSMHYGMCTTPGAGKGYVVRLGSTLLLGIGGTSGDAPQWAAFWAVANQVVGTNLGHAAPVLFRILRSEAGTSYGPCFHDVTTGNNGAYPAGVGYDKATGIGTPKFNALYPALQTLFAPVASSCFTDTTQGDFSAGTGTSVSATASPGDVKLAITSAGGESLNAQNTSLGTSGNSVTTTQFMTQTFTPTVTGTLTRVDFAFFCSGCSGANPNITVELRPTSGGIPTSTVLASTTIPGFSDPATVYYTATFGAPASVTAGTVYAVVMRLQTNRAAGTYNAMRSASDVYAGGAHVLSGDGGQSWITFSVDLGFKTYITTPLTYAASGDLISDIKDSNPSASGTPHVTSLTWTATTPAGTNVKLQLATSSNPAGPFNYLGPDGTSATFFTTSPASPRGEFFQGRYFRWRAYLSTTNNTVTPTLSAVTACYNNTCTGLPSNPVVTNNGPICAGASLQLSASTIPGATYSWTGPGAFSSSLQNPSIAGATTANSGTYGVKAVLGSCSSATVQTVATVIANGAACSDGNGCTQTDTCSAGACVGGNPVVCTISNSCHKSGSCNPATGICSPETTRFDEICNDGSSCTSGDKCGISMTQNFDQVPTLDAIPAPWTTSVAGSPGDVPWTLDSHSSQSAPVSAFTDAPGHVTDKVLVTPTFSYTSSPNNAYVSFFQRYQLQSTFDGAVLEISINGGAFTDILAAGGVCLTGCYSGTINNTHSSPIGGRSAWTGTSSGYPNYLQTKVNLPPAAAGQPVRLRWRVATDNATSSTGQSIDSITIVDDFPAMACTGAPAALPMEVGKILPESNKILWDFDAALSATSYVAMRGLVSSLPVGPGGGDETCSNLGTSLQFQDVQVPQIGASYWYLVRGKNTCGAGSWGTQSNGTPHVTTSCP